MENTMLGRSHHVISQHNFEKFTLKGWSEWGCFQIIISSTQPYILYSFNSVVIIEKMKLN